MKDDIVTELEIEIVPEIYENRSVALNITSSYYYPVLNTTAPFLISWARTMIEDFSISSFFACFGVVFVLALYLLQVIAICYGKHRLHRHSQPNPSFPGVSVIKPIIGTDENLYMNLRTCFTAEYHRYELLFCFNTPNDLGVPVVEQLMNEHPNIEATIFCGGEEAGLNPKINNMMPGYNAAKYPLVLISDSAIYMRHDDILDMASTLMADDKMALVTQVPYCRDRTGFASEFEQVYFGTAHGRIYLSGNRLRFNCPTGMSSMMKKEALDECGGFAAIAKYMAEDYFMGKKLIERGYTTGISSHTALQNSGSVTYSYFVNRIGRWLKLRLSFMPQAVLVEPFQECFPAGLVMSLCLNYLFNVNVWTTMTLHVSFWIFTDYYLMRTIQNRRILISFGRFILLWFIREISAPYIYLKAVLSPALVWRGNVFDVAWGGKIRGRTDA